MNSYNKGFFQLIALIILVVIILLAFNVDVGTIWNVYIKGFWNTYFKESFFSSSKLSFVKVFPSHLFIPSDATCVIIISYPSFIMFLTNDSWSSSLCDANTSTPNGNNTSLITFFCKQKTAYEILA